MTGSSQWDGSSPALFLLGFLVFLGSALLFLVDVLRSMGANAIGAALLMAWAAHDTLFDPNSEVATAGGAAGTALLLYGLYLFAAGVLVGATGLFFHDRAVLGAWYLGLAVVATVVGFVIFPRGAIVDDESSNGVEAGESTDGRDSASESQ
jgi:hypothetical protein